MARIQKSTLAFLKNLANNNDRDWFQANRKPYEAARGNVAEFMDELLARLGKTDVLSTENGKKSLFRINRDIRFSKDKSPYKTNLAGQFVRDGKLRRGGYYFSIHPGGKSFVGGGFYGMESPDLKRMRVELANDATEIERITSDADFQRIYGEMKGAQLKTAPQGYPKDHPNIKWLRYKQFYAGYELTDEEVLAADFIDRSEEAFLTLRPFFDYFTDVLTTDANGELIV